MLSLAVNGVIAMFPPFRADPSLPKLFYSYSNLSSPRSSGLLSPTSPFVPAKPPSGCIREVTPAPGNPEMPFVLPFVFSFFPEFGLQGAVLVEYIRGLNIARRAVSIPWKQ